MAIVVRGDALSKDDVQKAFDQIEEVDAVISTLGGTPGDPTADSQVICLFDLFIWLSPACQRPAAASSVPASDI